MKRIKQVTRKVCEYVYIPVKKGTDEILPEVVTYEPMSLRDIKRLEDKDDCVIVSHTVEVKNYSVNLIDFINLAKSYKM